MRQARCPRRRPQLCRRPSSLERLSRPRRRAYGRLRGDGVGPRAMSSLVLRSRVMRNRNRWEAYERAVCDMVDRTSTEIAPWTLVEANDKYSARIKVLETLCAGIRKAL